MRAVFTLIFLVGAVTACSEEQAPVVSWESRVDALTLCSAFYAGDSVFVIGVISEQLSAVYVQEQLLARIAKQDAMKVARANLDYDRAKRMVDSTFLANWRLMNNLRPDSDEELHNFNAKYESDCASLRSTHEGLIADGRFP